MITNRNHLFLWAALASVAFLWGVASPTAAAEEGVVEIEIGNLASYEDSDSWLRKEIAAFEEAHPHIRVQTTSFTEPFRERVPLHQNAPMPRNILGIDSRMGAEVPYLVERGDIVPIEQFLPDADFDEAAFSTPLWDAVTFGGKRWGVPWQSWGDVLVLDWELFEAAGFTAPPATWEEFVAIGQALTRPAGDDGEPAQWGLRVSTRNDTVQTLGMTMVAQLGGSVMKENRFHLDTPELKRAVELLRDMSTSLGITKIDRRAMAEVLADGTVRYGMHMEYINRLGPVLNNPKLRLAPMPSFDGTATNACPRRLHFAIRKATPAEEQASWELIKWFSRADISLPTPLNCFPVRADLAQREEFRAQAEQGIQGLESIVEVIQHGHDLGGFAHGRIHGLDELWSMITPVLLGTADFDDVIGDIEARANGVILPAALPGADAGLY